MPTLGSRCNLQTRTSRTMASDSPSLSDRCHSSARATVRRTWHAEPHFKVKLESMVAPPSRGKIKFKIMLTRARNLNRLCLSQRVWWRRASWAAAGPTSPRRPPLAAARGGGRCRARSSASAPRRSSGSGRSGARPTPPTGARPSSSSTTSLR